MLKKIFVTFLVSFLFVGIVNAQEVELPEPGMLPGHPLYFLKTWSEGIGTFFTFGDEAKAERMIYLSEKRLAEINELSQQGETELSEKTLARYEEHLNTALQKAQEAKAKGKDVDYLLVKVSEATSKHQDVLLDVHERVPEQAKEAIERAMEQGLRGQEEAMEAISSQQEREKIMEDVREKMQQAEDKMQEIRDRGIDIPEVPDMQDPMEIAPEIPEIDVDDIRENIPNVPGRAQ